MKIAIPIVLVALLGVAGWVALRPVESTPPTRGEASRATSAAASTPAPPGTATATAKTTPPPTVRNALPKRRPPNTARYEKSPTARTPAALPSVETPKRKWGRAGNGQPMPRFPAEAVKAGIRRYYANLPKSGKVPARIELEELFTRDLISALNLPVNARVVEIGHWPANSLEAFKAVLAIDPKIEGTLGITAVDDGERYREYVGLTE